MLALFGNSAEPTGAESTEHRGKVEAKGYEAATTEIMSNPSSACHKQRTTPYRSPFNQLHNIQEQCARHEKSLTNARAIGQEWQR